jgi:hypothetical protein
MGQAQAKDATIQSRSNAETITTTTTESGNDDDDALLSSSSRKEKGFANRRRESSSSSSSVAGKFEKLGIVATRGKEEEEEEEEEEVVREEKKNDIDERKSEEPEHSEPERSRLVARCDGFCPREEREMRLSRFDFDERFEGEDGRMIMKRYTRAFNKNPDEVRTLEAIERSLQRLRDVIEENVTSLGSDDDDNDEAFSSLAWFVWDRARAIRGDVTAQSACGPKARRIMRMLVTMLIRLDYLIKQKERAREYAQMTRQMKRDARQDHSMARMFREQLGKSLATYNSMCTERTEYVSLEEKAEVLAYRLLLRLSAKIEEEEEEEKSCSPSSTSSKLDNIDFRAAELDVLNSALVSRAMHLSVCVDAGKYVSFFKTIGSETFTFLEFCCLYACLDPLRARYLSRSNVSHNRMKMKKTDACALLKIKHIEKLDLLLYHTNTNFDENDIAFSSVVVQKKKKRGGGDAADDDVASEQRRKLESVALEYFSIESALPCATGPSASASWNE